MVLIRCDACMVISPRLMGAGAQRGAALSIILDLRAFAGLLKLHDNTHDHYALYNYLLRYFSRVLITLFYLF
ncbi:hypothetical protein Z949_2072 [Sulfitobacter guttiformis KCTC 32187]|nr:hypothetical protein Z949_2072 [Sulfitobacter guttiformis KCTC 32187]